MPALTITKNLLPAWGASSPPNTTNWCSSTTLCRWAVCKTLMFLGTALFLVFPQSGLDKLAEAEQQVATLSSEAASQQVLLTKKQGEVAIAMDSISKAMEKVTILLEGENSTWRIPFFILLNRQASERKVEVARLQKQLSGENSMIAERQTAVQEQLKDVQPLVDAAKRAVAQIKNDQIAEIRSLKSPPEAIYDVLEVGQWHARLQHVNTCHRG